MTELEKLIQAIAAIEAQRAILGDTVVEAALGPMREKLAQLSPQPFPVEGHRKLITVLFADISGFTALSEHLDAEDLLETINALWQQIDETIVAHGGRVDKHYGDGLMALWSAGEAREDDAERAIRAALSMQSILALLNAQVSGNPEAAGPVRPDAPPRLRFQLRMRIGLHTGPSMIGTVGATRELTAMGDAVNLASRLEHAAPIDGILISHDTYRQVRGVFDVSLQLPLSVKGKSESVQTYIVLRAKPRAFRLYSRGVEGLETHQVGRAAEMEQLQTAFETCISQHKTRLITVVGEAGLGKTRLMQEFLAWTELAPTTYILFHARATPGEVDSPYALLRDMLAYRFEILESDSLPVARAKLEKGFVDWLPGDPQAQEKAHFIGHLLGWDEEDVEDRGLG